MNTFAAIATIVASLSILGGPPITLIWRETRKTRKGVEWLLEIHNYPHRPPTGHYWPQVLEGQALEERSRHASRSS